MTGTGGLIGSALMASPARPEGWRVVGLDRTALELSDEEAVRRRFDLDQPTVLIHCAAMSRSPRCEVEPELASLWNTQVPVRLARLFSRAGRMVFLSTDLVFDGRQGWYRESDAVNPLSHYARTKVAAEEGVLASGGNLVVRTSLNHGRSPTGDRGFNEEMRRAWESGRTLKLFTDEFRTPIAAEVTARALWTLAAGEVAGIVHVAGSERLSRWEIGRLLAETLPGLACPMEAGSLREYQGAPRSPDTSLDTGRARALLGYALPAYSEWLRTQVGRTAP